MKKGVRDKKGKAKFFPGNMQRGGDDISASENVGCCQREGCENPGGCPCKGCGEAHYCSMGHAMEDWKNHVIGKRKKTQLMVTHSLAIVSIQKTAT